MKECFERMYDPSDYDETLADYITRAYDALEKNDSVIYNVLCSKITMELKTMWKCQMISKKEADKMSEYFWSYVS